MHAAANEAQSAALRTLLRSLGQIVLQANAFTGACLLAAWLLYDPRLACAALMGAVAANVSAVLADYCEDDTRAGLHGFNGALAGLAAFNFIADNATAGAVAILAATCTAWLLAPWSRWLRARGLGIFSSPCLIVTWLWLPLVTVNATSANVTPAHALSAAQAGSGLLAGFAQTGFASEALPGLLVLIGIAAASCRHALRALIGAGFASAAHLLLGATIASFDAGLLGFNGVLTALALADCGLVTMLGGVALSSVLQAAAAYFGWPVMTAPFVLATWSVQWLTQRLALGVAAVEPAQLRDTTRRATTPVPATRES
ncbi:urea transporter [Paraburkholderia phytofirmans]|uniref:Urea transporter n=1 Tax=Paraburkholderia phytofirmans (strain DSM 17436 / LMG 22146 / PsJN) TaxID=398527 RepID=B2TC19_PARPJ|nr:urea transporter [Paraburkholderia phytofirmans]ACD19239.1 Urea transporter [Paraburkholderia phytofirmans PsJN]